ncbi:MULTISPECIES: hypothetical protein [unclassified Streptomyces]|uniref:hypothetical protein n=1 Tax=unclassified Streptomyces TaxID=2593676 RepID=UPI002DD85B00|nr:hypothetical protein [Streptomyces sp. NBC_00151]WRZ43345.1 hypothetical protein OG915_38025 [Streptomyces sp. NBC_00151]
MSVVRQGEPVKDRDTGRAARGPASVLALLVPSLGIAALGVYHLCGFDVHALHGRPHLGDGLTMAGVITALVSAGAALGDLLWWATTRDRPLRDDGKPCPGGPFGTSGGDRGVSHHR